MKSALIFLACFVFSFIAVGTGLFIVDDFATRWWVWNCADTVTSNVCQLGTPILHVIAGAVRAQLVLIVVTTGSLFCLVRFSRRGS